MSARSPMPPEEPLETGSKRRPVDFLRSVLVLLLAEKASYGYELSERLQYFGFPTDMPRLYRTLASLERDGLVRGRSEASEVGPERRTYRVTAKGWRWLEDAADEMGRFRQDLARFSGRHTGLVEARSSRRARMGAVTQALARVAESLGLEVSGAAGRARRG